MADYDLNFLKSSPESSWDNMNFSMGGFGTSALKQAQGMDSLNTNLSMTNPEGWNFSGITGPLAADKPTFMQGMLGYTDKNNIKTPGWGTAAFDVLKSGLGFYLGKQQLDQAETALAENKRQFDMNFAAQRATINDQLRWQHNARKNGNSNYDGALTQI